MDEQFTAFINPGSAIATTTGTPPVLTDAGRELQEFILGGGNYIGINANGASAARSVQTTTLNTATIPGPADAGSTFDASFDTTNPVAWGFDLGGWIYRDGTGNAVFDGNTRRHGDVRRALHGHAGREVRLLETNAAGSDRAPRGGRCSGRHGPRGP